MHLLSKLFFKKKKISPMMLDFWDTMYIMHIYVYVHVYFIERDLESESQVSVTVFCLYLCSLSA